MWCQREIKLKNIEVILRMRLLCGASMSVAHLWVGMQPFTILLIMQYTLDLQIMDQRDFRMSSALLRSLLIFFLMALINPLWHLPSRPSNCPHNAFKSHLKLIPGSGDKLQNKYIK